MVVHAWNLEWKVEVGGLQSEAALSTNCKSLSGKKTKTKSKRAGAGLKC
jgi:hypothetical protein